ncbi:hypothetical protein DAI22_11g132751 [Oryza sativa Japonica Group]|nr:hypothetical protein DAI22_11g132751 [Oryza sativa Japonica Group]
MPSPSFKRRSHQDKVLSVVVVRSAAPSPSSSASSPSLKITGAVHSVDPFVSLVILRSPSSSQARHRLPPLFLHRIVPVLPLFRKFPKCSSKS